MRTVETTVYKYDELSDEAKAKAREWWRESEMSSGDNYFAETPIDDFLEVGAALGFTFSPANSNRQPRKPRDAVYFSGFWSQGDGASFDASWSANALNVDKVRAILADRPAAFERDGKTERCESNVRLRAILEIFLDIAAADPTASASVRRAHHSHFMHIEYDSEREEERDARSPGDDFTEACRNFASWLYRTLESEYEYLMSDECVSETIVANEYEFEEDGTRY